MSYTVLARRYRSGRFADVVGQQPISQTLRNAIEQDRVAHAYLFCGTRGVGKTSMARLFARALNAPDSIEDAPKTPGVEYPPEDVQNRMAQAVMTGDDLNVIEIDAASNRSVEEARQLIAGAGLSPTGQARFKIYIIDEVHMLTREAFNTLLKTMEEPPAHVKFILCTTEPHKVPPTIQSRCQRFDFRNIPVAQIADHLTNVLANEKVEADPAAVFQVARLANGSMRDALSLLDRLIATGQSPLTHATIEQMFGLPAADRVMQLVDAFAAGDVKAALEQSHGLLAGGIAQDQLLDTLIEQLRQLMLISACGAESELVELPEEAKQAAAERAAHFDPPALTYMIALCENLQRQLRTSANPRALLDAVVVRLALAENMADVTALLAGRAPAAVDEPKKKVIATETPRQQPTSAPPPPPEPKRDAPADPAEVLKQLRQRTEGRADMAWLGFVEITQLNDSHATIAALPGRAQAISIARSERVQNLVSDALTDILGRRMRVRLQTPQPSEQPAPQTKSRDTALNRAALDLPLVKEAMKAFPEATPISTRKLNE